MTRVAIDIGDLTELGLHVSVALAELGDGKITEASRIENAVTDLRKAATVLRRMGFVMNWKEPNG